MDTTSPHYSTHLTGVPAHLISRLRIVQLRVFGREKVSILPPFLVVCCYNQRVNSQLLLFNYPWVPSTSCISQRNVYGRASMPPPPASQSAQGRAVMTVATSKSGLVFEVAPVPGEAACSLRHCVPAQDLPSCPLLLFHGCLHTVQSQ